ncbi:aldo/keto reductase [Paenibacillus sp. TRM 82003]|uniref:aldo/keto reductase n=1 Tax=Kineococcus sp. TRM81007 TaxID=2925831 RepID=UPI001F55D8D1|nr:aldo/keto reductase [Kineococcus sp. TRM81007]MCI2237091.1 aldo/keto reductase [Kineococcus sp. TRM81007]MCI3926439.1 aldo/keto reductase [Paenibacillus sp. TRM 82003]
MNRTGVSAVADIALNNGVTVPQLGLGVFQVPPEEAQRVVEEALEVGYRHVDTAAAYVNEAGVGAALRASGLPRDEVFVTSKLRNGDQGYDEALRAYADTCERLGVDTLDLYLVHWPNPSAGRYVDSWRALERLHSEGTVRAVGVSNFLPTHLDDLAAATGLVPAVNQVELHPTFQQRDLVEDSRDRGIVVEAYSPLGQGADLDAPAVLAAARAHDATPAQVVLAWHLQRGHVVIPKSSRRDRLEENLAAAGLHLDDDEVDAITALERGHRIGGDPATFALSQIR